MDESKHEIHSQVDAITAGTASMVNLTTGDTLTVTPSLQPVSASLWLDQLGIRRHLGPDLLNKQRSDNVFLWHSSQMNTSGGNSLPSIARSRAACGALNGLRHWFLSALNNGANTQWWMKYTNQGT